MNWKEYQRATAEVFRSIGWEAEEEAIVEGVRGTHEVDVYVTFKQHGLDCSWVVECKHWQTAVPKEKVAALKAIVDDIGADKGVLVSKEGFQSGAISLAIKSNIILTSLDTLIDGVTDEIRTRRMSELESRLISSVKVYDMLVNPSYNNRFGFLDFGINGKDGQTAIVLAWLLREASKNISEFKLGNMNFIIYDVNNYDNLDMSTHMSGRNTVDIDEFLNEVESVVKQANIWVERNKILAYT